MLSLLTINNFIGKGFEPILISILATMAMTFFSMIVSNSYKKNFKEYSLLAKIINHHLKDSPTWLNLTLGVIVHFFVGYLFTLIHLYYYQILIPAWYNAIFLGLINGIIGAIVWYIVIKIYAEILNVSVIHYLIQLVIAHVIFAIIILYMYSPIQISV